MVLSRSTHNLHRGAGLVPRFLGGGTGVGEMPDRYSRGVTRGGPGGSVRGATAALAIALSALLSGSAAAAPPDPYLTQQINRPPPTPPQNTAHTTPTTNPSTRLLPQARQVGNPTGPVPNTPR